MKYTSFTLSRAQNLGLRAIMALIAFLACGPIGLLAVAFNPNGFGTPLLGMAYPTFNASTKSDITTQNAKNAEELWCRGITFESPNTDTPLTDGLGGKPGSGKAIIYVRDFTKLAGNTVHIPTRGGFAGPPVYSDGDRTAGEQKTQLNSFEVKIGRVWFGYAHTGVALDETMLGTIKDQECAEDLRMQVQKKKHDDRLRKLIQRAGISGRNYMLPDGISSRATLANTSVMTTTLVGKINSRLRSNGGVPMSMVKDDGGSMSSKYVILSPSDGLKSLKSESLYVSLVHNGDTRGNENAGFKGNFKDLDGVGLYNWEHINHGNWGPVGSPLLPRAYLGNDIDVSGSTAGILVEGGGSPTAAAIMPAPTYMQDFSNAPWTFSHGEVIAAVTGTDRYIKVTNPDGSGSAVLRYRLNDGLKITLPATSVTTVSGSTATALIAGALIEECNVLGWTFCRHIGLAQQALVTGAGSIQGTNGASGKRTEDIRNHGNVIGVGIQYSDGCEVYTRADGSYPGFVLLETAFPSAA